MDNQKYAQLQFFTLAGAGVSLGDGSMTLSSFKDIDGNLLAMSDFGTSGFGTVEPGSLQQEEQIVFTGVVQNIDGTATLTGVKNVSFLYPYTQTANFSKSHAGGVKFIISNTSGFYDTFANKNDTETINQVWTFDEPNRPVLSADVDATLDTQLITRGQMNRYGNVLVDANDTTPDFLDPKQEFVSAGGSVQVIKTIQNPFGNEKISYNLEAPGAGGGILVQDEGVPLPGIAMTLNFTGDGVTASGVGGLKTIDIPKQNNLDYTVNADETVTTWFTQEIPAPMEYADTVGTRTGPWVINADTNLNRGTGTVLTSIPGDTASAHTEDTGGTALSSWFIGNAQTMTFTSATNKIRMKFVSAIIPGLNPSGDPDFINQFIGLANTVSVDMGDITSIGAPRAGFATYDGNLYAIASDGIAITPILIGAYVAPVQNALYEMIYDSSIPSIDFYVNGTLATTIITNIPVTGDIEIVAYGRSAGVGGPCGFSLISNLVFSQNLQ